MGFIVLAFLIILNLVSNWHIPPSVDRRIMACRRSRDDSLRRRTSDRSWTGRRSSLPLTLSTSSLYLLRSWVCTPYVSPIRRVTSWPDADTLVASQCLTYISLSGLLQGVDPDLSFYLLSIANASSVIGRLGGGLLADRIGTYEYLPVLGSWVG